MPVSSNEPACPKFQPNIFDPSRCHDCLRQRHLHAGGGESKEATPQRSPSTVTGTGTGKITAAGDNPENGIGTLPGKGDALQPLPSQADERNTSGKEDSDGQSVRSSYCVSGGRQGFHESSLCILSPDCELYICDGDDDCSTDSGRDYPELSDSVSTENDYLPICRRPTQLAMTRLDPPPHHPNPRAWMEEARDRDSFSKYSGFKGERENRDSGYFSLGRAEGSRSFRDKSPPASFRHFERGHPVFNTRNIEPKDTIPFRNPNLGVASERTNMEVLDLDLPEEIFPPDPYDIAIEVEAQVGPRSPSPTPFKIAESLVSTGQRRVGGSYGRGSHSSSYQQSGRLESSRQGSTFQSRSSSPSRGQLPFRRSESTTSLNRNTFNDRGRSQGLAQGSRSPSQGTSGRVSSGTVPMNFKAFTSSAKSQPTTVSDFRNALRKTGSNGLMDSRSRDGRSSPSSRKDYNPTGQSSLRKTEQTRSLSTGQVRDSRNSSPSRRSYDSVCDGHSSLPTRRNCSLPSQTLLHKWDSVTSLSGGGHRRRCGSPIREGYDIESQILLRSPEARDDLKHDHPSLSPTGGGHDAPTHVLLRKTVSSGYGVSRGGESRSSSPGRRSYADPGRYQSRKTGDDCLYKSYVRESRTSSALKRTYDTPGQSLLWKSETSSSIRSGDARSLSPHRRGYDPPGQLAPRRTENISSLNSRCSSPSRKGNGDSPGYSVLNKISHVDTRHSYQRKGTYSEMRSDGNRSPRSWRDSTHSLRSSSVSRAASPSHSPTRETRENGRKAFSNRASSATREASRSSSVNRSISSGRGLEEGSPNSNAERSSRRMRSPSPPPRVQMRRHTSSQSSMESSESGQPLGGSAGRSREEYAVMADVPRVKMIHPREGPGYAAKPQSHRSPGRQELFKPASHSLSKHPSREWEDPGDMERECLGSAYTGSGHLSRAHSSTSLYMQGSGSPTVEEGGSWKGHRHRSGQMQPDLLNFKKGWMSKLDDNGEWKKHWFVLTDAGLKYYRDSGAEEKDELDGEIDLKSCVKVSEFDVEKNYGFQIQTREAVFTLSAMTAGIRRNWIEVLRKSVRPSSSPDLTQLPDSSSDKENSLHTRSLISSRRTTSRHVDARSEIPSPAPPAQRRFDSVELSPVPAPTGQREVGEGQGREHGQWQEERNRDATSSQWEALLSRKGSGSDPKVRVEEEIERKWVEFERMPLKEMRLLPPAGLRSTSQPGNEALQREVASLRQQLERRGGGRGEGGGGVSGSGCGPEAPCGRSLAAMERAHQQALEELRRQHDRQARELGAEQDRLLLEESRDTARVMEALKKAHKEELEREVEKAKRLGGGFADSTTLRNQQQAETQALQRELAGLSERYSQKCLELNRAEQANAERERELSRKERDMEQLRKENQDLQARLKEEMRSMSSVIAGQGSGVISNDKRNRTSCELEVLLRVKEHEVDYLHKEISCLRNELQFLNTENRVACKRYTELHEELSGTKSRSEREIQGLKEHLRLAMAALQEGQMLGNSLDH